MMECRLCLRPTPVKSSANIHDDSNSLSKLIQSCCQLYVSFLKFFIYYDIYNKIVQLKLTLQMKECDSLPNKICPLCESYLKSLTDFKTLCHKNDKIIRLKLGKRSNVKVEETILDDLVWDDDNYNTNAIDTSEDSEGQLNNVNKNKYDDSLINKQNNMEGKYSQVYIFIFVLYL